MHIRIVSPAGSIKPRLIDNGAQTLKSWGHKVTVAAHAKGSYGRFSGTPQERAQDLLDALEDKDVDIIWCSRGGYGCMQILDMIPIELISRAGKPIIGYSDITALHALWQHAGVRSSRAYYQYMLDLADDKVSYYSTDDISQIIYDLLDDGDAEEAMAACQKGLDQHPEDEFLELIEAKILLHMNRYDEAEKLVKGNPDEQSPFGIGIHFGIDVKTKDQEEAYETLFRHLQKGDLTGLEFVEIIDELFDHLPHHLTAEYITKAADVVVGKPSKAEEQDAEALGRMGALLMDCNCHRDAIPVLEHALDMDAYDVYSWQDLSRCQFELQMFDECRNSCEMGIAIDPKNPLFNFALGFILYQKGEHTEAVEHLEVARQYAEGKLQHEAPHLDRQEVEQQTSVTYELLGSAYMALDEFDKARECYLPSSGR